MGFLSAEIADVCGAKMVEYRVDEGCGGHLSSHLLRRGFDQLRCRHRRRRHRRHCHRHRRVIGRNGEVFCTIVMLRAHVVPLNSSKALHHNSIPRLELTAAEKGTQLRQFI